MLPGNSCRISFTLYGSVYHRRWYRRGYIHLERNCAPGHAIPVLGEGVEYGINGVAGVPDGEGIHGRNGGDASQI